MALQQLGIVWSEWLHLVLIFISVFAIVTRFSFRKSNLPPGPLGWPLLGYIKFVFAEKPTKLLKKMKEQYGNVFGFNVGSRYCVVLSDYVSVKEGFSKKSVQSRPPKYLRTSEHKNFSELDPPEWEIHRKFVANWLRELGVGSNRFEELVQDDLSRVIPKLESYVDKPSCNIRDLISTSMDNTILQLICSRWFDDDHPVMKNFQHFLQLAAESFTNNMAFLYFPWLDRIFSLIHPHYRAIAKSMGTIHEFISSEIKSREKTHDENSTHDYIDLYLNEMKRRGDKNGLFNVDNLIANSILLLTGGSDTTRNTMEWLLMSMAQFPEIQKKVYDEIMSVIGSERQPAYKDKPNLPFTEATIMESQRWKTLAPLNVLRWTTEDTVIQGYHIPKNTVVINNLRCCHNDTNYFPAPKEFKPERFLSKDRSRVIVPESFLPFSLGRRNCPGDRMASIVMFLYFTTIIQKYKILPPTEGLFLKGEHRINMQAYKPVIRVTRR